MSSRTDLSDIGLCSFNSYEINFNILLCYLCDGDVKNSLKSVSKLIDSVPSKYKSKLYLVRGLLYQENQEFEKCKKDFMKSYTNDPQLSTQSLDNEKEVLIEPFETHNRLWSKFPHIKIKMGAGIYSRPSFSIPFIKPPNMIPNVDEIQMKEELNLKHLGGIKPEAPWIKRWGYGIKFTDEIQEVDFKIEPDSHKNSALQDAHKHQEVRDQAEQRVYVKRSLSEQVVLRNHYSRKDSCDDKIDKYGMDESDIDIARHQLS